MKLLCRLLLILGGVFASTGHAEFPTPAKTPITGARMPALSPDGKRVAFTYRGDIWMADTKGGRALPLTQHVDTDAYPLFSPDGHWVAFASRRNGNWDIFIVAAEGGRTRQLTYHSGSDIPHGWSHDGKSILFSSRRDSRDWALYSLDVATLRTSLLTEDYAPLSYASMAPDGKTVAYARYGFHWTRPRYTGAAAAQLWLLDLASGERHGITQDDRQHLFPRFMPDGKHLLTVTVGEATPSSSSLYQPIPPITDNAARTPNLWLFDRKGTGRQITTFVGGAVRYPSVAAKSGDMAFEYGPDLWVLRDGKKKPEKLKFFASVDDKQTTNRREKLSNGVQEAEPSPDGKNFAFGLRGDIWTIAIEKPKGVAGRSAEFARRLTDWAGEDSDFSWSPDGKKIYFTSDREFYTRIYEVDVATQKVKPLWQGNNDVERLQTSPDGKKLSFWLTGREGGLYVLDLEGGKTSKVVSAPGTQWRNQGGGDYAWSPDLKWIAYALRGESKAWNIWIVPSQGGTPTNVTRLYAQHSQPAWSPDGKYLFFQSNREGNGLYIMPLIEELVRSSDSDMKFQKSTNDVVVKIDFDNISSRIRKFSSQTPSSGLVITAEGVVLFISEGDIWSANYDGKETKKLTSGGGKSQLRVSKDGKKAYYVSNGELYHMGVSDKKEEKVSFTADWERDVQAERRAAFTQFWRSYQRGFYDANFHGRNWEKIRQRYEPLLDAVETNDEFASLLQMMVGELEASHAEVTASNAVASPVTPNLGFTFDYSHAGPGIKVREVPRGAPGYYANTGIKAGEYVLAINGRDVSLTEDLYELINDRQDREFEFLVSTNGNREGARTVKYKVLTQDEWSQLNYRNRIERLRDYVEKKSGGKIGYLHLASMQQNNQTQFEREAYEYIVGKDAMIIDVRFNTGGNIADTLIDWLDRKPHGYIRPRDGAIEASPFHAWDRKMVVIMNEHSYSNAEIFPYAMRARGLATLIGLPTPGYVIWTDSLKLVDGTNARMPMTGAYRLDGSPMENIGEKPDLTVNLTPEDWLADRDPQLDAAIENLTSKVDEE